MALSDDQKHSDDGGVTPIQAAMLDRLAELAKGNEARTFDYLVKKSTAERQAALNQRRQAAGLQRLTVWVDQGSMEALKVKYPGPRGGIDWEGVVKQALRKR